MPFSNYIGSSAITQPGVVTSTTRPATPYEGQVIYETDTNRVLVWDNSAWVMIADTGQPPGLQLIKTQTVGTGVASVTVNDVFSSNFDSYFVSYSGGMMSADTAICCQIGSATTGYYGAFIYGQYNSSTVASANDNNNSRFTYAGGGDQFNGAFCSFVLSNPFLNKQTYIQSDSAYSTNVGRYVGRLATSTSYTSFSIFPFSGTLTGGTIRVYGYRNTI